MGTTRSYRALAAALTLSLHAACATMPAQSDDALRFDRATSRAIITAAQLQGANVTTMQEALLRLRPGLFIHRAAYTVHDPYRGSAVLYIDGQLQGGLDLLNTIPLTAVRSVHVLSGNEGHSKFGRYHPGGVVDVKIRR
ncbi:MAG: hypothetical protein ABIT20_23285 [Gemmatimonadaceae bacterium]